MTRPVDMSKFLNVVNKIKLPDSVSKGFHDPDIWVDTGNYTLNYLISGDYFKGVPLGKVTVFAGDSGCLPSDAKVVIRYRKKESSSDEDTQPNEG